jgi:outer membrane murein-binding lipoprotein Lpp
MAGSTWAFQFPSGPAAHCGAKQMFGKNDLVDNLSRELVRARKKHDALISKRDGLAADVTTLTAQIAEMEARVSEEKDRRERERFAGEVEEIKKRLNETATAFAPVIIALCDATEKAAAVVPEARDLNNLLKAVATEVDTIIDPLLGELHQWTEAVRTGHAAPHLPQPLTEPCQPPKNSDRLLYLPKWLPRNKMTKIELTGDRCSTAA